MGSRIIHAGDKADYGDSPAAMRYTEAKMPKLAVEMLADIDKNTVDFMPNYDEKLMEPTVLPAKLPNLLINGSSGIAVGMATNVPPHNLTEVVNAIVRLIDEDNVSDEEVNELFKKIIVEVESKTGAKLRDK